MGRKKGKSQKKSDPEKFGTLLKQSILILLELCRGNQEEEEQPQKQPQEQPQKQPQEQPRPRDETVSALHQFVKVWEEQNTASRTNNGHDHDRLRRLEEAAERVRVTCHELDRYLDQERRDFHETFLRLEQDVTQSFHKYRNIYLVCRSLRMQHRNHVYQEQLILRDEIPSWLSHNMYPDTVASEQQQQPLHKQITFLSSETRALWVETQYEPTLRTMLSATVIPASLESNENDAADVKDGVMDETIDESQLQDVDQGRSAMEQVTPSSPPMSILHGSNTILGTVDLFLHEIQMPSPRGFVGVLFCIGPEGCGKTHLCDQIGQRAVAGNVEVLRPSLPLDLMGSKLGEAEDRVVSLMLYAATRPKCIVILDNADHILGTTATSGPNSEGSRTTERGTTKRMQRSTFLRILDSLRDQSGTLVGAGHLLVVCTASYSPETVADVMGSERIDRVFTIHPPGFEERKELIRVCLGGSENDGSEASDLLTRIANYTVGRSCAELAQYCRRAITSTFHSVPILDVASPNILSLLRIMEESLKELAPESLRAGVVDDFVDMRVLTAQDLLQEFLPQEKDLPLFGQNAQNAWNQMQSLIVTPLCQSDALEEMLYGRSNSNRSAPLFCGGVLLTGQPGTGKTSLARYVAGVAAMMLPSVKLLDVSGTSLVHKEVGGSERAMHRLFQTAQSAAPCIILMDGVENVAAVRGHDTTTEGTMDRLLSTLLMELDGIQSNNSGGKIAMIGITHNVNWIDPALCRPGRLAKVIELTKPERDARKRIVSRELGPYMDDEQEQLVDAVVAKTNEMTGAEIVKLCEQARMHCLRSCIDAAATNPATSTKPTLRVEHIMSAIA